MSAPTMIRPDPRGVVSAAIDRAVAEMPERVATVITRQIKNGANHMLMRLADNRVIGADWRLYRPFQGLDRWKNWEAWPVVALLDRANEQYFSCRQRAREGHWTYSYNMHLAWAEARLALRYLRRFVERKREAA